MAKAKGKNGKIKDLKGRKTISAKEAATVKGGLVFKLKEVLISSVVRTGGGQLQD